MDKYKVTFFVSYGSHTEQQTWETEAPRVRAVYPQFWEMIGSNKFNHSYITAIEITLIQRWSEQSKVFI